MIWQVIAESLAAVAKETAVPRVEVAATPQSAITFWISAEIVQGWNGITSNLFRSAGGRGCARCRTCTRMFGYFLSPLFVGTWREIES